MSEKTESRKQGKFARGFRKYAADIVMAVVFVGMVSWMIAIVASDSPNKPSWLLVPLTAIYAQLTLYVAVSSFQNAVAARRSAQAMEESVKEQRLGRLAAFSAFLAFKSGYKVTFRPDGTAFVELVNLFGQPAVDLSVKVWQMDPHNRGSVRYSSMMESPNTNIGPEQKDINLVLTKSTSPETVMVKLADIAIDQYKDVFAGNLPSDYLCLMTYSHRADTNMQIFVYDLIKVDFAV